MQLVVWQRSGHLCPPSALCFVKLSSWSQWFLWQHISKFRNNWERRFAFQNCFLNFKVLWVSLLPYAWDPKIRCGSLYHIGNSKLVFSQSIILMMQLCYIKVCGHTLAIIYFPPLLLWDVFKDLWAINQLIVECILACWFTYTSLLYTQGFLFKPLKVLYISVLIRTYTPGWVTGIKCAHRWRDQGEENYKVAVWHWPFYELNALNQ